MPVHLFGVLFRAPPTTFLLVLIDLLMAAGILAAAPSPHGVNSAEADAKKFSIPDGFQVELWAAEPLLLNPVAFSFDEQGRAYIAETHRFNNSVFDITQNTNWLRDDLAFRSVEDRVQFMERTFGPNVGTLRAHSERLQLVLDSDRDGRADTARTIAENFREIESGIAAGVLAEGTNLWFACIPDLWRYTDSDGDGIPDSPAKLHSGFGVHIGVTGHDLHGLVMGPDERLYFSVGDRGANLSAAGAQFDLPHTGAVFRCDPDGSNLELFATGLRNPQELAFDQWGNLWTGDNDTAGADDCRLLYVVQGGDYGWRFSYQHMRQFGPWVEEELWKGGHDGTLTHSGNPAQGPSGLAYYPGSGLPPRFNDRFFICDFPGGIHTFRVEPSGAGFLLRDKEKFLWNAWPTDVAFGPGPGVYVLDWVGGWTMPDKGRIYHIFPAGSHTNDTAALLRENPAGTSTAQLAALLAHADMRIRQRSQFELARRDAVDILLSALAESPALHPRIHALWALSQIARRNPESIHQAWPRIRQSINSPLPEIRAQIARFLTEVPIQAAKDDLRELLRDQQPRVQFFAIEAAARLGLRDSLPRNVQIASENSSDAFLVHAAVRAIDTLGSGDDIQGLADNPDSDIRRLALLALRRQTNAAVAGFLQDQDSRLVIEAARAINDVPIPAAAEALAALPFNSPAPAVLRMLNANYRLGAPAHAARLLQFARSATNQPLRLMALEMLSEWATPDPVDKVVGLWRPIPNREAAPARDIYREALPLFLEERSEGIVLAAITTAQALQCEIPPNKLTALFDREGASAKIRAAAMRALSRHQHPGLPAILGSALSSPDAGLRTLACDIAASNRTQSVTAALTRLASSDRVLKVRQAALRALQNEPSARPLFERMSEEAAAGKLPAELSLELHEVIGPVTSESLLHGGNSENGRVLFHERADVSCLRCHSIRGAGGTVGPDLTTLARTKDRAYLLESIIEPNKSVAQGYEQVVLLLKDQTSVAGLLRNENDSELIIESPEDGIVTVPKSTIATRTRSLSAMPEGLGNLLTPRELRDLVEYLASLK